MLNDDNDKEADAIVRMFPDICSWINYAENTHPNTPPDNERSSRTQLDRQWCGVSRVEEAFDTLRSGWPAGLARMRKVIDCVRNIIKIETPIYEFHDDIEGFAPNVEAFIHGAPEDMFAMEPIRQDAPPTYVCVQIENAVSAMISADQLTWAGATLFAAIEAMRIQGCNAELLLTYSVSPSSDGWGFGGGTGGRMWMCGTPVPNTLDMDTLAFLFTHPACFRNVVFSMMEHENKETREHFGFKHGHGYGRPSLVKAAAADVYLRSQDMCLHFSGNWDANVQTAQMMLNKLVDTKFESFA